MKAKLRISPQAAWAIAGLSAVMIGAGILLWALAIVKAGRPVGLPSHQITTPVSGAVFAALGGLVLSRHHRHPIAWILTGLGFAAGLESLNLGILVYTSLRAPGEIIPAPDLAHWLAQWIWSPRAMIPLTFLLLLFPNGRPPSRRWLPVVWAAAAGIVGSTVSSAFEPGVWEALGGIIRNPYAIRSDLWSVISGLSSVLLTFSLLASLVSIFVRFRRGDEVERQQLKWMMYTVGLMFVLFLVTVSLLVFFPESRLALELAYALVNLVAIGIAGAVGIAVLRYHLYDIDLIINRTLVYGALSLLVVGLYVLIVGTLSTLFQARGNLLISLAATGLIAVLFQPVKEQLQRSVNRLLYGERDEPYDVLVRLGRRLEDPRVPEAMLGSIVDTISQMLKLPYVAIAFHRNQGYEIVSESGKPTEHQITLPLEYKGGRVGRLICAPRGPEERFTVSEQRLLEDIAVQAAVAVHALKLGAELQHSRERLVTAREEERRRLRRDLHDGLGPKLASLGFKLDAARNKLLDDPSGAETILRELRREVKEAVGDIRRLVHNLRPPALDDLGLLPALRASAKTQLSSAGLHVEIEGPAELPELPAAVEVAAYRITQEALTNVLRHARAGQCSVHLRIEDNLELDIRDDGTGLPEELQPGVGLRSMQERTEELGGTLRIDRLPEKGTRLVATIPLPPR